MTFGELLRMMKAKSVLIITFSLVGILVGASAAISSGSSYRYTDLLVVSPAPVEPPQGSSGLIKLEDGSIVKTLAEVAQGKAVHVEASTVAQKTLSETSAKAFSITGSNVVQIEVSGPSRSAVRAVGTATTAASIAKLTTLYPSFSATSINGEEPPVANVTLSPVILGLIGLAVGFVSGVLMALAIQPTREPYERRERDAGVPITDR